MNVSEWLRSTLRPMSWSKTQAWKVIVQGPVLIFLDVLFLIYVNSSNGPPEFDRRIGLDVLFGAGLIVLLVVLWISWKTVREPE